MPIARLIQIQARLRIRDSLLLLSSVERLRCPLGSPGCVRLSRHSLGRCCILPSSVPFFAVRGGQLKRLEVAASGLSSF